jgi:hypothetical protein
MNAVELAKAFSEELRRVLTADEMGEVNRLNAEEANSGVCHSHDFCDANQVMLDAMGDEFENTDEQNALISQAWNIAKAAEFDVDQIDRDDREMARG